MSKENIIVLTIYGKEKTISHVSVSLFDSKESAGYYCDNINTFSLQEDKWVYARIVKENEKIEPIVPKCMDMKFLNEFDDRWIQWLIRRIDIQTWALAMTDIDDGTKERIFRNMSQRKAIALQKDMNDMRSIETKEINKARQEILDCTIRQRNYYRENPWMIGNFL
jgi:flagellar motor switch protein FliG